MEKFELNNYPFDVQDLTAIMNFSFDFKEEAIFVPWDESYSLDSKGEKSDSKCVIQFNCAFSAVQDFDARRIIAEFAVRENSRGNFGFVSRWSAKTRRCYWSSDNPLRTRGSYNFHFLWMQSRITQAM